MRCSPQRTVHAQSISRESKESVSRLAALSHEKKWTVFCLRLILRQRLEYAIDPSRNSCTQLAVDAKKHRVHFCSATTVRNGSWFCAARETKTARSMFHRH